MSNPNICMCECHRKGMNIMHFMACCQYTYKKYLTESGEFDKVAYDEIVAKANSAETQAEVDEARENTIQEALKRS